MKHLLLLAAAAICTPVLQAQEHWQLVWADEFNEDGPVDASKWGFERGFVRNFEDQWYQPENAVCRDGVLVIEGRHEEIPNPAHDPDSPDWRKNRPSAHFTSASMSTAGKFDFQYGRLEVRAKIPTAPGAWPAIWTLGRTMPWPSCGEIDVMEFYRVEEQPTILANAAWGSDEPYRAIWDSAYHPYEEITGGDPDWDKRFHTWRMDWDEEAIELYLDDRLMNRIELKDTYNGKVGEGRNPFMQPHFIILNLALGGQHGGVLNAADFPMRYEVDYVRVFQRTDRAQTAIRPGALWLDNRGHHINAHGGGILESGGRYYWFGEHKSDDTSSAYVGINCYSSDDLVNWTFEGVALPVSEDPESEITAGCIMERPKVIYNPRTGKYVMWFHLELKGRGYEAARTAVAWSDSVCGPYHYVGSVRPCAGVLPRNLSKRTYKELLKDTTAYTSWTPEWVEAVRKGMFVRRDMQAGQMARDMTLFVDDDGKAYHIYSSEENQTLHIAELADDFLSHTGRYVRVAEGDHNEAPAIFKHGGYYWLITSDCTGWAPNAARMFRARSIWGPWEKLHNPCRGPHSNTTFFSQGTYVLPLRQTDGAFIFMADRWTPEYPSDARYIWLPIQFDEKGIPFLEWMDEWDLQYFRQ